jgi:hypothetical protein
LKPRCAGKSYGDGEVNVDLTGQEAEEEGEASDGSFHMVDTTKWARPKGACLDAIGSRGSG